MCGIAGYLNFNKEIFHPDDLEKMLKTMEHRGGTAPKFKTRCLHDIMDVKGEKSYAQRTPISQQGS